MMRRAWYALLPMFAVSSGCAEGEESVAGPAGDAVAADVARIDAVADETDALDDAKADAEADAPIDTSPADALDVGLDTSAAADAIADTAEAATDGAPDAAPPWRKTIVIDGTNDFSVADEKLTTTSTGYDAYMSWDGAALYVGYSGADIGPGASSTKWLFVYLDADPGAGAGATRTEQYKDQSASLPVGYGAEAYFGWRTDGTFSHAKKFSGGAWTTVSATGVTVARSGSFVEIKIPFALLGATPTKLGVVTLMMNEGSAQWSYGGLYAGSFADGYYAAPATVPVTYYLQADLASPAPPASLINRKP
jgi:hypothetical protein